VSKIRRVGSWIAAKFRAAVGRLRGLAVALAATLRDGARGESRRRRKVWVVIAALLVLGPLAFNLARAADHRASVELFPREVEPYRAVSDAEYYRSLLDDPPLRQQMRLNARARAADYDGVTIRRGPRRGALTVTVAAGTPARAQRLVNALAPQIAGATQRQLARLADDDARTVRRRLRERPSRAERRQLRRRLRRLNEFGQFPPPRVLPGAQAPPPRIDRWADQLVDDLPGDFPPRPSPAWAALAGLLVTATLWAIFLVLMPPGRPRSGSAPAGPEPGDTGHER